MARANKKDSRKINLGSGRVIRVTEVFDTYWRFAAERQDVLMRRVSGQLPPWTDDVILQRYRFTNAYRASDRVSQFLIRHVIYSREQEDPAEVFFRVLLFKFFNRIETWQTLEREFGEVTWRKFDVERYGRVLDEELRRGRSIYSAAYIMPSPTYGQPRKHRNHLLLLHHMMRDSAHVRVARAKSLRTVFETLRSYQSLGDFLAFQFAIDLNYSELVNFSEMEFVVAGPGARDGLRKCVLDAGGLSDPDLIRAVADMADAEFERLSIRFKNLWGRKLQLIDCQNLFCEVGKYARVRHPEHRGESGRIRIKQRYVPVGGRIQHWYPPKWKLQVPSLVLLDPEDHPPSSEQLSLEIA